MLEWHFAAVGTHQHLRRRIEGHIGGTEVHECVVYRHVDNQHGVILAGIHRPQSTGCCFVEHQLGTMKVEFFEGLLKIHH